MYWNKGRLCWKIAKLFYFCHLKQLVRPETFGPYHVLHIKVTWLVFYNFAVCTILDFTIIFSASEVYLWTTLHAEVQRLWRLRLLCSTPRVRYKVSAHRRSSINHSKRTKTLQTVGCSGKGINHDGGDSKQCWEMTRQIRGMKLSTKRICVLKRMMCRCCVQRRVLSKVTKYRVIINCVIF